MSANTDTAAAGAPSPEELKVYALQQKYAEEVTKRVRPDGLDQFITLRRSSDEFLKSLNEDPWANHAALNAKTPVKEGGRYKYVIVGAGYGGLTVATRLIDAGLANGPDDIRLVDNAGGFGGTWYWNRYPGLHCDVESYIYMPLLEETGYVPTAKYAAGPELLEHAERIATQWNLHDKALFRSQVSGARWDEEKNVWLTEITEGRGSGQESKHWRIEAENLIVVAGVLSEPHVPKIDSLDQFEGKVFHTSRWHYDVTGGTDKDPQLAGLEGKRVGILGTGATVIQCLPHVAKFAKDTYVFQRTPSHVFERRQRPTDPEEW